MARAVRVKRVSGSCLRADGQADLSRGMGWLQNAFTRRINTRHGLWGHLFGGPYKAILAEPGNCFWALLDYIHLLAASRLMISAMPISCHSRPKTNSGPIFMMDTGSVSPAACASSTLTWRQ